MSVVSFKNTTAKRHSHIPQVANVSRFKRKKEEKQPALKRSAVLMEKCKAQFNIYGRNLNLNSKKKAHINAKWVDEPAHPLREVKNGQRCSSPIDRVSNTHSSTTPSLPKKLYSRIKEWAPSDEARKSERLPSSSPVHTPSPTKPKTKEVSEKRRRSKRLARNEVSTKDRRLRDSSSEPSQDSQQVEEAPRASEVQQCSKLSQSAKVSPTIRTSPVGHKSPSGGDLRKSAATTESTCRVLLTRYMDLSQPETGARSVDCVSPTRRSGLRQHASNSKTVAPESPRSTDLKRLSSGSDDFCAASPMCDETVCSSSEESEDEQNEGLAMRTEQASSEDDDVIFIEEISKGDDDVVFIVEIPATKKNFWACHRCVTCDMLTAGFCKLCWAEVCVSSPFCLSKHKEKTCLGRVG